MKKSAQIHLAAFTALVLLACSSSSESDKGSGSGTNSGTPDGNNSNPSKDGGSDGSTSPTTSKSSCCLNGAFYACPTEAAMKACAGLTGTPAECAIKCKGDPQCLDTCLDENKNGGPDTSGCERDKKRDEECIPQCTGIEHVKTSTTCSNDSGCTSVQHCFAGRCYLSSAGAPCEDDSQCGSVATCKSGCCEF